MGLPCSPIKIWGKSVQVFFLSYDRKNKQTDKQRLYLNIYRYIYIGKYIFEHIKCVFKPKKTWKILYIHIKINRIHIYTHTYNFPVPVCTVPSSIDRTSRCNKVDAFRHYASYRLNLLLPKGQICMIYTHSHLHLHTQYCSVRPVKKLNRIPYFEFVPMFCLNLLLSLVMFRLAPDSDLSKVFVRALRELNEQDGSTVRTVENFVLSAYQVSYTQVFIN